MRHIESGVDFIDMGCDYGTTIDYCRGVFDGGSVIAIDTRDDGRKEVIEAKGNSGFIHGDALVEFEEESVRFVSGGHFLEHLSGFCEASVAVNNAMSAAKEFVFFNNPDFSGCKRLHELGYRYYWEEYYDHTFRVTRKEMVELAKSTGHPFCVFSSYPVIDSNDTDIWPFRAKSYGCAFDGQCEKKEMVFEEDFFKIVSMVIWKKMTPILEDYLGRMISTDVLYYDGR